MPELLSPAGNFEKLKAALLYGADAVYAAGLRFGMRSAADNFTVRELYEAAEYTHERGKKLYLTVNTMPRGYEYDDLRAYLGEIRGAGIDAMIVADLGVMQTVKDKIPDMEIHMSTQTSIVSPEAARAYAALGAKRLVLARELTLHEIAAIRAALPEDIELEAFIHGSMCVSYSGRCMLSHYLTGRDANRGACTQPCRWGYTIYEDKRPDVPIPLEENENGTFIMSSKDMCTISLIPELMRCGIDSFKIEGRMKSAYYAAVVTNAYRMAIDAYLADPEGYAYDPRLMRELESVSHREYATGYYQDSSFDEANLCTRDGYIREKAYFATATEPTRAELDALGASGVPLENENGRLYPFIQRNKIKVGDRAQRISPGKFGEDLLVSELYSDQGEPIEAAPHPAQRFWLRSALPITPGDILRGAGD